MRLPEYYHNEGLKELRERKIGKAIHSILESLLVNDSRFEENIIGDLEIMSLCLFDTIIGWDKNNSERCKAFCMTAYRRSSQRVYALNPYMTDSQIVRIVSTAIAPVFALLLLSSLDKVHDYAMALVGMGRPPGRKYNGNLRELKVINDNIAAICFPRACHASDVAGGYPWLRENVDYFFSNNTSFKVLTNRKQNMNDDNKFLVTGGTFNNCSFGSTYKNPYEAPKEQVADDKKTSLPDIPTALKKFAVEKSGTTLTYADFYRYCVRELGMSPMTTRDWADYASGITGVSSETIRRSGDYTRKTVTPGDEMIKKAIAKFFE